MSTRFGQFWYPDFLGIAYAGEKGKFLICPYFDDKEKAEYVYSKIKDWNPKFIRVRFIEYGSDEYAFVGYQNPKASYEKITFGLYRSSMDRKSNYSKFKNRIQEGNCGLLLLYTPDPNEPNKCEDVGSILNIQDCKIIDEAELQGSDYPLEKWAHDTCKAR